MAVINPLVEGEMDEAVAFKLIDTTGHSPGVCYGKKGCGYIKSKIQGFNLSARYSCYLTLVDIMDTGISCPADVVAQWLPHSEVNMIFRVVVREIESWLMADRHGLADFLGVSLIRIPTSPEQIEDPKRELVNIARRSRKPRIRSAIVPDSTSTAQVGRLYLSELSNFINVRWQPQMARMVAPSLDRCLKRLESLA